jgi:predicted amidohydrolase YtcJ
VSDVVEIRRADVDGRPVDVRWRDGHVLSVLPAGARPPDRDSVAVVDAGGGALIPGLHDHHIHLLALAAQRTSVNAGPPAVTTVHELVRILTTACETAMSGWVRAVGYHESVAGDLDALALDRLVPAGREVSIRVQHRSGQLWILNQRALDAAGVGRLPHEGIERDDRGAPTGRVFGLDDVLRGLLPEHPLDLPAIAAELASYGVTGVTDLTPTGSASDVELLARHATDQRFPLRVTITGGLALDPRAAPQLDRGPVKFLPIERDLADVDALGAGIAAAHASGRPVAVHCVSRVGLVVAIAAWRAAGAMPGDRVEHGAVIPDELLDDIADLGLTVVTQPNLVAERGDQYVADAEPDDQPHLWRCRSLLEHGIGVAGGTDAPFGDPDPWRAVGAAVDRTTPAGVVLGADERLPVERAVALFLGRPHDPTDRRRVRAGEHTDLCLLDRPLATVLDAPTSAAVRATVGRAGLRLR